MLAYDFTKLCNIRLGAALARLLARFGLPLPHDEKFPKCCRYRFRRFGGIHFVGFISRLEIALEVDNSIQIEMAISQMNLLPTEISRVTSFENLPLFAIYSSSRSAHFHPDMPF